MKKITKLGMAAAVLFCVVGLGSHTQAVMAAEETTIENGISIGNVNVGGMTENQAISAVEEYVDGLMDTTFTLRGETGSIQMTAEDMGVTADADTAVQEALAVGHAGSLINRYKTLQDLKKKKLVLDMHLSVNKQATAEKIYESADDLIHHNTNNSDYNHADNYFIRSHQASCFIHSISNTRCRRNQLRCHYRHPGNPKSQF